MCKVPWDQAAKVIGPKTYTLLKLTYSKDNTPMLESERVNSLFREWIFFHHSRDVQINKDTVELYPAYFAMQWEEKSVRLGDMFLCVPLSG